MLHTNTHTHYTLTHTHTHTHTHIHIMNYELGPHPLQVFDVLKEQSSNWMEKIKMVEGALEQPDLGLSEEDLRHVSDEVSVVFHTAATIKFDAPLRCVHVMYM